MGAGQKRALQGQGFARSWAPAERSPTKASRQARRDGPSEARGWGWRAHLFLTFPYVEEKLPGALISQQLLFFKQEPTGIATN